MTDVRSRSWLAVGYLSAGLLFLGAVHAGPTLAIQTDAGHQVRLTWPAASPNFLVEQATSLKGPVAWTSSGLTPTIVGDQLVVVVAASDTSRYFRLRSTGQATTVILDTSPTDRESGVSVTRETIFHFSAPLGTNAVLTTNAVFAQFGGRRILSRAELSKDRLTASLFYLENLPAGARIRRQVLVVHRVSVYELQRASGEPLYVWGDPPTVHPRRALATPLGRLLGFFWR